MYFCPNCFYILDIEKSSNIKNIDTTKIAITKAQDILKKIENKEDLSKYKSSFDKEDLLQNKKYQKLTEAEKNQINLTFDDPISYGAEFKCDNCNYTRQITQTILLYQSSIYDDTIKIKNLEENELECKNPILPHTHDYTCKNLKCLTHKTSSLKDAVFYKNKYNYKVSYICCVCYYNW
jgi:hypothetical protein